MGAGRKKKYGGAFTIEHSQMLFEQSVASGHPDYSFVALAIGSVPGSPPDWAIWACIKLRQAEERKAARGIDNDIPAILDEVVRYYDKKQREFERQSQDALDALETYSPPSLRSAIRDVLTSKGLRSTREIEGNDDWFRDIREAWDWEQKHDLAPSSFMQLEPLKKNGKEIPGLKITSRIDRVLGESVAAELDHPADTETWAWIAKRIVEQRYKKQLSIEREQE